MTISETNINHLLHAQQALAAVRRSGIDSDSDLELNSIMTHITVMIRKFENGGMEESTWEPNPYTTEEIEAMRLQPADLRDKNREQEPTECTGRILE